MFIAAIICMFVVITVVFAFARAIAKGGTVSVFDPIGLVFAGAITYLLVYSGII